MASFFTKAIALSSQRAHRDLIPSLYRRLVCITDHLADAVVVNCEFLRRHLERDERLPSTRVQLCYNGLDLEEFGLSKRAHPPALAGDALVIGTICALRPEKDLQTLIAAFARVREVRPLVKLAIVGDGPSFDPLQSQARALGLQDDCVFAAATDHVAGWLRAIDIFVLPSRSEALSNSLMEAMACGCCAVASNVGGNPELIQSGETGLLFEAGDVPGLTDALDLLACNQSLRHQLAVAGMHFVRSRFAAKSAADRMGEIYSALIERRARLLPEFSRG